MSTTALSASTPHYVLMDESRRIGPKVVSSNGGHEPKPIYVFSSKDCYDQFCRNSDQALKPYPLVKGYLRSQIDEPGGGLKLVVMDAAGPREPYLLAATMEAVLEAFDNQATLVVADYRLLRDPEADAYEMAQALH